MSPEARQITWRALPISRTATAPARISCVRLGLHPRHLGDGLSLEELGGIVHLHPVYLSKLYKQETGENLSSYILRARLEKSAHLLEVSHLHVMDIARMVGYRKPQYFIKLFKELYGITPYQYRRQQIEQAIRTDS